MEWKVCRKLRDRSRVQRERRADLAWLQDATRGAARATHVGYLVLLDRADGDHRLDVVRVIDGSSTRWFTWPHEA